MSEQNRQCSDTGCDKTSCESCDHANTAINFSAPLHEMSTVKKVIGIVSGKGGVTVSLVAYLIGMLLKKKFKLAILNLFSLVNSAFSSALSMGLIMSCICFVC